MDNSDIKKEVRKEPKKRAMTSTVSWSLKILFGSFLLSVFFKAVSETALPKVNILTAFLILALFVLLGIIFDIFGVATATATEKSFHSMASKRVPAARQALWLVKNAEKVSSFCNDVVGDICGIISGSTATIIITSLPIDGMMHFVLSITIGGLVAGITVGGKAFGKGFAMTYNDKIVFFMARIIRMVSGKR